MLKHYTILPSEQNELQAVVSTILGKRIVMPEKSTDLPIMQCATAVFPLYSIEKEWPTPYFSTLNDDLVFDKDFCSKGTVIAFLVATENERYEAVFVCGDGSCYVFSPREPRPTYTTWRAYTRKKSVLAVYTLRTGFSITSNRLTYEEKEIRTATREAF